MTTKGAINYGDKINVLQQSSLENYSDQSNKRQIIFLCPNPNNDIDVKNSFRSNKKKTISTQDKNISKMHYPLPVAVARRNARERNRVKQVNNGFATLRQHIPTTIAAGCESGNGRGSNKKLSKVETLRMAVEYIKSLEKLLNITEEKLKNNTSSSINNYTPSYAMSESSSPFNLNYSYSSDTEDGMRSSKDNNYHLLPEDEENIHPLKMEENEDDLLQNSNLINSNLEYAHQNNMLLHSADNNGSLSSEVYSEHSLSPIRDDTNDMKTFIPAFNVTNHQNSLPSFSQLTYDKLHQVKLELLSPNLAHNVIKEDSNHDLDKIGIATKADVGREHDPSINIIWWGNPQQSR